MHSSVLQNKKYIKFANQNTVEVIAVSRLDQAISKNDPKAGTYAERDKNGNEVQYLVSWPGLTVDDMKKLSRSKAPGYNDTRGIPYVAIVNPHTLEKFDGWNGGSAGKIMDAVEEAKKKLQKEYGKSVSRKDLMKVRKDEAKVRAPLAKGDLGKAWTLYAGFDKKISKKGKAFAKISEDLKAELLKLTETRLDELERMISKGDLKQAEKELRTLARPLKGTPLEERLTKLAAMVKPTET